MQTTRSLPSSSEYLEALQNPQMTALTLADKNLKGGSIAYTTKNGRQVRELYSGGCAITFHYLDTQGNGVALRCFSVMPIDMEDRYAMISEFFSQNPRYDIFTSFEYQKQGIRVKGEWYPILVMDWVQGERLFDYLESNIHDSSKINELAREFRRIVQELKRLRCAHGDLQLENILVVNGQIRLVDYDGMFVPALKGKTAVERGLPNFQHPARAWTPDFFNDKLDHFSAIVIYLSLLALGGSDQLYTLDEKRLLFTENDYNLHHQSAMFACLEKLGFEQAIREMRTICSGSLDEVPSLEDFIKRTRLKPTLPRSPLILPTPCEQISLNTELSPTLPDYGIPTTVPTVSPALQPTRKRSFSGFYILLLIVLVLGIVQLIAIPPTTMVSLSAETQTTFVPTDATALSAITPSIVFLIATEPLAIITATENTLLSNCQVETLEDGAVNMRVGPGKSYRIDDQLKPRTQITVIGRQIQAGQETWWQLINGLYVRADTVREIGDCRVYPNRPVVLFTPTP